MAHIDTTKIEGFDGMTDEQKVNALLGFDIPDAPDMSKYVAKSVFDKASSDLAKAKKDLQGKMSEDELKAAKQAEKDAEGKAAMDDLQSKYDELLKRFTVETYKTNYISLGYDSKLAQETAEAMASGDMEKVFANQKKHGDAQAAKIREDLMKGDPRPAGGGGDKKEADVELAKRIARENSADTKSIEDTLSKYKLNK